MLTCSQLLGGTLNVIAITLCYSLRYCITLLYSLGIVIDSNTYRSKHKGPITASYSYRSDDLDKRYRIYSLSLLGIISYKN
jgi:hypothetical protein